MKRELNINILSKEIYKNIALNYGFKGFGIILNLLAVRINLMYLGISTYGIWITISSIASWVNYGDLGIGNGLRNQLAIATAENDLDKQKKLIVTATETIGKLSIVLFSILCIITEVIFWFDLVQPEAHGAMHVTNAFFCLDLFMGIGRSIALGYQKSWITSFAQLCTVGFKILGVLLLLGCFSDNKSLLLFAVIDGIGSLLGNVILWSVLIKREYITVIRNHRYYDSSLMKKIINLGMKFFLLQLTGLILYASDNLIINKLFSSGYVTKYEIITKIYNTGNTLFSILLISLWSAVTFAMTVDNYKWIKQEIKKILFFWGLYAIGVVIVSLNLNTIIELWLGNSSTSIFYESPLIWIFAIHTILSGFGAIFVNVSNGLGRLKIQMSFSVVTAVINVPLSIFFAKNLNMGIFGIKLATLVCCVGSIVFVPLDIIKILSKKE